MTIATSENWRDKTTGERKEKTEWHNVVVFNEGLCKVVEQYLKKGAKVYVEGALQTRKWQDKDGRDRYTTEVVLQGFNSVLTMLDGRAGTGGGMSSVSAMQEGGQSDYLPEPMERSGPGGPRGGRPASRPGGAGAGASAGSGGGFEKDLDDEIPF